MAPEGMRARRASTIPANASNSVCAVAHCRGGNQTIGVAVTSAVSTQKRAMMEAAPATTITRRYCIKATSLESAPNSSAINTMAAAAPGEEPQIAVVPGSTLSLLITQPIRLLAAIVVNTINGNNSQCWAKVESMPDEIDCATRQPIMACAAINNLRGSCSVPPARLQMIPATIGPSSKAPGRCIHCRQKAKTAERMINKGHCITGFIFSGRYLPLNMEVPICAIPDGNNTLLSWFCRKFI